MKDSKNITFLVIPYLTICGALYHISYWDTFDVNGLAFITLSDIIKSSVYPILSSVVFLLLGMFVGLYANPLNPHLEAGQGRNTFIRKMTSSEGGRTVLLLLWIAILFVFIHFGTQPVRWITSGFIASLPPAIWLERTGVWIEEFPNLKTRIAVFQLAFYLPILSFSIGKYNSENIYRNLKYKYTVVQSRQTTNGIPDTIKFLGLTDKYTVFTDLKNSQTIFIKTDKIDTLVLKSKE